MRIPMAAIVPLIASAILMAPAAPAAAEPSIRASTIVVTPSTDLVDQLYIGVSGTGFSPNTTVAIRQCGSRALWVARCGAATLVTTDGGGGYATYVQAVRSLTVRDGSVIDCEQRPGRCGLYAAGELQRRLGVGAPITFNTPPPPTPPPPPPPPPPPLPPADPPADHLGLTWRVKELLPAGGVAVGTDSLTNPYEGDTAPETSLPILCLFFDGSPYPSWFIAAYGYGEYNAGWARGWVAATPPVSGTQLTSRATADAICASHLGPGWRMAEHHDPWYGNPPMSAQWNMWAYGSIPVGTRLWTAIDDQYGNPWD